MARVAAWISVLAFGLLLLAWLILYWAILPHIERWRPDIEARSSAVLGVPVRIGSIAARSSGWVPTVDLRDVVLLDAQLRPALRLAHVVASISARSMLASAGSWELRLAQLLIEGARLEVRRDAAGRVFVAGLDFSGASADSGSGAVDWLLHQHEFAVRGASVRWTDELRGAPPLELSGVDFVAHNTLRSHAMRLDATPPAEWGDRFSLRGQFTQPVLARSSQWWRWSGQAYADAPRADATQLRRYLDLPFELSQGVGAVRAWLDVSDGAVSGVTLDLSLRAVTVRLGSGLEPLVVDQLQGRLSGQRRADGGSFSMRQVEFTTGDGVHWPPGDLDLTWTRGADGNVSGGTFSAGRLDLAIIAHTAERLPLGEAVRALLTEYNPRGVASEVRAGWSGPLDTLTTYRLSARINGLALDAKPAAEIGSLGRPGLQNAAVDLSATEKGGEATLAIVNGTVDLPGVFAESVVPLDQLQASLRWRIEPRPGAEPALQVQLVNAHLANPDAQGEVTATWSSSGPAPGTEGDSFFPGRLELDATLTRGVATRAARYLPLGMSEGVRSYIEHALLGGTLARASFRVNGNLSDFPFSAGAPGEFRIAMVVDDVTLAYVPAASAAPSNSSPWPPMTHVSAEIDVDRTALAFRNARARIYGVEIDGLKGGVQNLGDRPILTLDAQCRGPVADMLHFVAATPVGDWIHGALRETTASGSGKLALSLTLPLRDLKQSTVKGSLQLAGNDVRIVQELPLLAAARGRVDFTGKGLTLSDTSARVLGGEMALGGGTQPDGSLRFNVVGNATAEGLRRSPELGPLARLASALNGQTGYRLALALAHGQQQIDLTSDLVGLGSDLPAPLGKAAEAALPLHVQTTLAGAADAPQDTLRVDIGAAVRAQFQRDLAGDAPRVLRGGIGVFAPAPMPANGVAATIDLPRLDMDAWVAVSERMAAAGSADPASSDAIAGYVPNQVSLKAQELVVASRKLTRATVALSRPEGHWHADIDADQLAGRIEYRPPSPDGAAQAGRVYARLTHLSLPKSDADEVTNLLDRQPASVPALDIVVDDLELRGRKLGRIEIQAVNRLAPEREWVLTRLRLSVPEAQINATGRWAATAEAASAHPGLARRQAELQFELDISDSGALLQRLGSPGAIRGGKGRMAGQIAWLGSPLTIDYPSLSGKFNVAIEQGQFMKVEPGAARLLGVLSLQSLARRLTFDFRDLFLDGFVFDSIVGDVAIARGLASTNTLLIRGVQAAVLMEGSADIARETQDLRIVVVPEINAGAASLAVAVVNPALGLGTFLAQLFLREPLIQANTHEFHVTGSWADPQVEEVARPSGQAAPRIGPPAAAASGASSTTR